MTRASIFSDFPKTSLPIYTHFFVSFILLSFSYYHQGLFYKKRPYLTQYPTLLELRTEQFYKRCFSLQSSKKETSFLNFSGLCHSYLLGKKNRLLPQQKEVHRFFYLQHLLTPSGQHLQYIYFFLRPIQWFPILGQMFYQGLCLLFCLFLCFLPVDLALRRMAAFHFIFQSFSLLNKFFLSAKKDDDHSLWVQEYSYLLFFLFFMTDFFLGTYQYSPLSFSYSFLFLGTLLLSQRKEFSYVYDLFFILQALLITQMFQTPSLVHLHALIFHFLISWLANFIFIIFIFGLLTLQCLPTIPFVLYFNNTLFQLYDWCSSSRIPSLSPGILFLILNFYYLAIITFPHSSTQRISQKKSRRRHLFIFFYGIMLFSYAKDLNPHSFIEESKYKTSPKRHSTSHQ
jgi:hypothetical protein